MNDSPPPRVQWNNVCFTGIHYSSKMRVSSTGNAMKQRKTKRISLFFTEQQLDKVASIAADSGLTQSEIIRRALDYYLANARSQYDKDFKP